MHSSNYGVESNHSLTVPFHKVSLPLNDLKSLRYEFWWPLQGISDNIGSSSAEGLWVSTTSSVSQVSSSTESYLDLWETSQFPTPTSKKILKCSKACALDEVKKRQIIMTFAVYGATTIFYWLTALSKKHFFCSLWILHKAPYGELKQR